MSSRFLSTALVTLALTVQAITGVSCKAHGGGSGDDQRQPVEQPLTPADLVAAAERALVIDHDTALLYLIYAMFDPVQLPAEYRDGTVDFVELPDPTQALTELARRIDDGITPPAIAAAAAPFFLRPTDPLSFWARGSPARSRSGRVSQGLEALAMEPAGDIPGKVIVWQPVGAADPAARTLAQALVPIISASQMYDKFQSVMGRGLCPDAREGNGPDERLDIYVVPPGRMIARNEGSAIPGGAIGVALPGLAGSRCPHTGRYLAPFILIRGDLVSPSTTVAHELFHAFQQSFGLSDDHWWDEATAVWAEDHVFPLVDEEWGYLFPGGFWERARSGPLDSYAWMKGPQYSSFIFPFLLTHDLGMADTYIGHLFETRIDNATVLRALEVEGKFEDAFKRFALANWNQSCHAFDSDCPDSAGPQTIYRDHGTPISAARLGPVSTAHTVNTGGETTIEVQLPAASYQYDALRIDDDSGVPDDLGSTRVHQLSFDFSQLHDRGRAAVQAIVVTQAEGVRKTEVRDWTNQGKVKICRDSADQATNNVESVLLIIANTAVDPGSSIAKKVTIKSEPTCTTADGTMDFDATLSVEVARGPGYDIYSYTGTYSQHLNVHRSVKLRPLSITPTEMEYALELEDTVSYSAGGTQGYSFSGGPIWFTGTLTESLNGHGVAHAPSRPGEINHPNVEAGTLRITFEGGRKYRYALVVPSSVVIPVDVSYSGNEQNSFASCVATYDRSAQLVHFKETDNGTDPPTITERDDGVSVVVGFPVLDSELSPEARALFTGVFSPADGSISGSVNIVDQSCQNAVQTSLLPPPVVLACYAEPLNFLALPSCMLSYSFRFKISIPD